MNSTNYLEEAPGNWSEEEITCLLDVAYESVSASMKDQNLRGTGGMRLKNQIWDAAKSTIEEWTGMELKPSSMYGIRVYTEGGE